MKVFVLLLIFVVLKQTSGTYRKELNRPISYYSSELYFITHDPVTNYGISLSAGQEIFGSASQQKGFLAPQVRDSPPQEHFQSFSNSNGTNLKEALRTVVDKRTHVAAVGSVADEKIATASFNNNTGRWQDLGMLSAPSFVRTVETTTGRGFASAVGVGMDGEAIATVGEYGTVDENGNAISGVILQVWMNSQSLPAANEYSMCFATALNKQCANGTYPCYSVVFVGERLVVGVKGNPIEVYSLSSGGGRCEWTKHADELTVASPSSLFAYSVSGMDKALVVGDPGAQGGRGAMYLFHTVAEQGGQLLFDPSPSCQYVGFNSGYPLGKSSDIDVQEWYGSIVAGLPEAGIVLAMNVNLTKAAKGDEDEFEDSLFRSSLPICGDPYYVGTRLMNPYRGGVSVAVANEVVYFSVPDISNYPADSQGRLYLASFCYPGRLRLLGNGLSACYECPFDPDSYLGGFGLCSWVDLGFWTALILCLSVGMVMGSGYWWCSNCSDRRERILRFMGNRIRYRFRRIGENMRVRRQNRRGPTEATSEPQEEELDEANDPCTICYERNINVVLAPCGHENVCKVCAEQLDACPHCRKNIEKIISVYHLTASSD